MGEFPALEMLTAGFPELPLGSRVPITGFPFYIGRAKEAALRVPEGSIARRHCQLLYEHDRWWIRDLGSTNGTFHLGEQVHDAELLHGDCFEVAWGVAFRLLLHEPVEQRSPELERAILERPDEPERWSVYADWLQEQGDPLGERMAHPLPADDRRWLGPLAGLAGRGELQVDWAHGLPSRAVLRCLTTWHAGVEWPERLATLLRQPQFRFLRQLEVDVGSFLRASPTSEWGAQVLEALGPHLPLLERLAIGPGAPPVHLSVLEPALAARRARFPCFATTAETLYVPWRPATLTWQDRTVPLDRKAGFRVGPPGADLELGPGCPALGFDFSEDRWRVTVDSAARTDVKINGLVCRAALLRGGDVLEPLPGTRLRFEA